MHAFICSAIPTYITKSPYVYEIHPENSIGITEIRESQIFLSRLPPENKKNYLIVHQAEKMTLPAQNAFLKTLEEPPSQTEIYLVTNYPDELLPTILSRVEFIKDTKPFSYTSDTLENSRTLWKKLQKAGVGERLAVIDEAGFDRETFLHFLSDLEYMLHENLSTGKQIPDLYALLITIRHYTKSNCNMRLIMDFFGCSL